MGRTDFLINLEKAIMHNTRNGYNLNVMHQSAFLVINQITVDNFDSPFNSMTVYRALDSYDGPELKLSLLVGRYLKSFVCRLI